MVSGKWEPEMEKAPMRELIIVSSVTSKPQLDSHPLEISPAIFKSPPFPFLPPLSTHPPLPGRHCRRRMAEELHREAELCLPSEFLCDDFFLKAEDEDREDELETRTAARSALHRGGRCSSSALVAPPEFFWQCDNAAAVPSVLLRQQAAAWLQFHQLKQIQLTRRRSATASAWTTTQSKARGGGTGCFYPSPWRSLHKQQQCSPPGAGMRAVFLKCPGARSESAGTGVFLPRPAGDNSTELMKKPVCSTVLVPERVIQALNLSPDDLGRRQAATDVFSGRDALVGRASAVISHQRRDRSTPARS